MDGLRYQALNQLDRIVASIHTDLNHRVYNAELRGFLKAMLSRSQEFVRSLFEYITDSYAELIRLGILCATAWSASSLTTSMLPDQSCGDTKSSPLVSTNGCCGRV